MNTNWSREEHILAFNLYCKIPFTKINAKYQPVKDLARILGRTDGSVAMKLANFARLDPVLKARNVSGLTRGAKGEEDIWNEFNEDWNNLGYESEKILARYKGVSIEESAGIDIEGIPAEGKEREATVKVRVNHNFFSNTVRASYEFKCCITGLKVPDLLVAGHIKPWAKDLKNGTNPSNGLCINALHDRAFENGLITVTPDYIIKVSEALIHKLPKPEEDVFFIPYQDKKIILPKRFLPSKEFLEWHGSVKFKK
jgi:putative restriction endonuclease